MTEPSPPATSASSATPSAPPAPARRFVPQQIDLGDWSQLEPLFRDLLDREFDSPAAVERWLTDYSELAAAVSEYGARRQIDHACHTDDAEIERAFMHFIEQVVPRLHPVEFELQQKLLASPHAAALDTERYRMLKRDWQAEVELFRQENVPLFTDLTKLASEYDKIVGAMEVDYAGRRCTLQQIARYQEEPDRAVREQTWRLATDRRLEDRGRVDDVFDRMLALRGRVARHADQPDYRAYAFKHRQRFDYTPEDCLAFGDAIEQVCVPLLARLDAERRDRLGVETLRPWDTTVDPDATEPLAPYDADDTSALLGGVREMLTRVGPDLGEAFARLRDKRNLDLESRRGKRAGGFQAALQESGEPFIFMNAAGLQRDVETLLHEAGHAFHFLWSYQHEPLTFIRHAPIEFCEVASMSMELMAMDHLDVFYRDAARLARAKRKMLEGIVRVFPWIATIDGFQHWLYTQDQPPSAEARTDQWLSLMARFGSSAVDWSGLENARASLWQRQLHLFHHPFYYVEYGIAQLGALQIWARYRQDPPAALRDYRRSLSLGGTRPLPALFEAAGLRFDFTRQTLEPAIHQLARELEATA
ncbi:MAG: M3 family oligoendopeptidase [Phycisphaeraceae bacterium]